MNQLQPPNRLFVVLILAAGLAACKPQENIPPTVLPTATASATIALAQPTALPSSSQTSTPSAPDVTVNPGGISQPSVIHVGQTLAISNPNVAFQWQVTYSPNNFLALTSADQMSAPGSAGWRFKAIRSGEAQIVLTSIVSARCDKPPCPPAPMPQQFVIKIEIQP